MATHNLSIFIMYSTGRGLASLGTRSLQASSLRLQLPGRKKLPLFAFVHTGLMSAHRPRWKALPSIPLSLIQVKLCPYHGTETLGSLTHSHAYVNKTHSRRALLTQDFLQFPHLTEQMENLDGVRHSNQSYQAKSKLPPDLQTKQERKITAKLPKCTQPRSPSALTLTKGSQLFLL